MAESDLEKRLATLEVTVERLRAALDAPRSRTMSGELECPSCGGGVIYHFKRVPDAGRDREFELALARKYGWFGVAEQAKLEAYACFGCGLVEWHVTGLTELMPDGETVTVYRKDVPPKVDPYR